jgi:hypothetical protein
MSTLEAQLRDHFAQIADREGVSPNVSIAAAASRGRKRLRWRRVRRAGTPVLAASAVAAVALAGIGPANLIGPATLTHKAPGPATAAITPPRQFSPLVPYASFGWLPSGGRPAGGGNASVVDILNADTDGKFTWQLYTYARGACRLQGGVEVQCTLQGGATQSFTMTGRAPSVHGRQAFWAANARMYHQAVAWRYAPGSWAVLDNAKGTLQSSQTLLRIARGVIFGGTSHRPVEFAAQLTGVPATWRISNVAYRPASGTEMAYQYLFAAAGTNPLDLPLMTVSPGRGSCYFYPDGQSVHRVINGYPVVVNTIAAARGNPTVYQVCVPDADGLSIFISVDGGKPVIQPVTLFRHMRLLGTNPASWVTQPTS